jgi:hypothetical protein
VYVPYDQAYAEGFDDMRRRVPDISKIQALTGWQPRLTLLQTLRDVIAYLAGQESPPAPLDKGGAELPERNSPSPTS